MAHSLGNVTRQEMHSHTGSQYQTLRAEFSAKLEEELTKHRLAHNTELVQRYTELMTKFNQLSDAFAAEHAETSAAIFGLVGDAAGLEVRVDMLEHPWRTRYDAVISAWHDFRDWWVGLFTELGVLKP